MYGCILVCFCERMTAYLDQNSRDTIIKLAKIFINIAQIAYINEKKKKEMITVELTLTFQYFAQIFPGCWQSS